VASYKQPHVHNFYVKIIYDQTNVLKLGSLLFSNLVINNIIYEAPKLKPRSISHYFLSKAMPEEVIHVALPMIYPPLPWSYTSNGSLIGGYLSTAEINRPKNFFYKKKILTYLNLNLITTPSLIQCSLQVKTKLLNLMTGLQNVPFKVNFELLNYINANLNSLVAKGILIDPSIMNKTPNELVSIMKTNWINEGNKETDFNYNDHLVTATELISKATNQYYILKLANIFDGLTIYYPVSF